MKTKSSKVRVTLWVVLGPIILLATWLQGVYVGKYETFPYSYLISMKDAIRHLSETQTENGQPLPTGLVALKKSSYDNLGSVRLLGWGGGLAAIGDVIIGVDSKGHFFRYEGKGHFRSLPITLDTNEGEYQRYLASTLPDSKRRSEIDPRFRVLDLEAKQEEGRVILFVSYNYWHAKEVGKTVRVARLVLNGGLDALDNGRPVGAEAWEVIYETKPLMPFSLVVLSPFNSDRSGGRIVVDGDNGLLVSFGDQQYDGNGYPSAPRDTASSYGKVIRIQLESLKSEIFALGVRNPQGLVIDLDGNLWETEHGPKGGDELNLLHEGHDYGWPSVTYGTDYGRYSWPLNPAQGRHDQYDKPVFAWVPSIATSNLIQINGTPRQWDGDLIVSSLRAMSLFRVRVEDGQVRLVEPVLIGERIRDLIQMQDGTILLWTDAAHFVELTVDSEAMAMANQLPVELTSAEISVGLDRIIQQCQGCHGMSPRSSDEWYIPLWGVYGRGIAATGYSSYSGALRNRRGSWTEESLASFLSSPSDFAPGSEMPDPGISDPAAIRALVGYLKRLQ